MPKPESDFFAYFIKTKDKKGPPSFAFGSKEHIEKVRANWSNKDNAPVSSSPHNDATDADAANSTDDTDADASDFTHQSALSEALTASVDFGLAQHELIEAAVIAPLMIRFVMAATVVIKPVIDEASMTEEDERFQIFGLTEQQYSTLAENEEKYSLSVKGMERFPSATLLSLVATFDTLILDVLAKMLRLQNDWLEKSERTIPLSKLANAESLGEVISEQIREEIYQFSRGSHTEQAEYIRRNFGINIIDDWKRWPDYIEIFERRNLVAHGEKYFNQRYISICEKNGHKGSDKLAGSEVKLSSSYLCQSLNVLIEFAVLFSFSLFRKFVKEKEEEAFTNLNDAVFKLIQKGHFLVADRLAAYALGLGKTKITEEVRLMLIVNRASAVRHDGRNEEAREILAKQDWSASSDLFQFCVAAVEGDTDKFISDLPKMKASQNINTRALLTWPCFSFMREDEAAQEKMRELFGIFTSNGSADVVETADETVELSGGASVH